MGTWSAGKASHLAGSGERIPLHTLDHPVAYFSMEIGVASDMPTYSGGLGVLSGDTVRAAADMGVPMVAVTLVHRHGYFRQRLDPDGTQAEAPATWRPEERLEALPARATLRLEGRDVQVRAWRHQVAGINGALVPVLFLDTDVPENAPQDRMLTNNLYGGDTRYRLLQEAVLGVGGIGILRAAGYRGLHTYHMNEGHSAFLTLALMEQARHASQDGRAAQVEAVRRQCVFTTHTPVPAGHDQFPMDQVEAVLGPDLTGLVDVEAGCDDQNRLNMTALALHFSRYINGVSMLHRHVSKMMFPKYPIDSITNGVHAATWTAPPFQALFDRHVPEWRRDNLYLRYALDLAVDAVREAHAQAKRALVEEVRRRAGVAWDASAFTIGFARRATPYKRADLLFHDPDRIRRIARRHGALQVAYAGKAHPRDEAGKALIRRIHQVGARMGPEVRVVYLEEYDMDLARILSSGVDLWLNTPLKPQEASGTSGMKAALNGVPSLSVRDGWWVEGGLEGVTGWTVEDPGRPDAGAEAASLYDKLERLVLPLFHRDPRGYGAVMRNAIALNGSFFNAQRMLHQYVENAYRPLAHERADAPQEKAPTV